MYFHHFNRSSSSPDNLPAASHLRNSQAFQQPRKAEQPKMDESEFYPAAAEGAVSSSFFTRPANSFLETGNRTVLILNASSWMGQAFIRELKSGTYRGTTVSKTVAVTAMADVDTETDSESTSESEDEVFHPPQQHQRSANDLIHAVSPQDRPHLSSVKVIASTHTTGHVEGADETVYVDFDAPDSLDKVLQTHKADYILYIPSFSENRIKQTQNVIDVLLQHRRGVRYLIMISILAARPVKSFVGLRTGSTRTTSMANLSNVPVSSDHVHPVQTEFAQMEKIVAKSGISHTFLQVGLFDHQLFEICRRSIMMNSASISTLGLPLGMGTFAPVDVRRFGLKN
jgi:hypothetical protein